MKPHIQKYMLKENMFHLRINAVRFAHSENSGSNKYNDRGDREPHCTEASSFSKEFEERIPSNKARATLSEAYQHSGVDAQHPKRPTKEELSADDAHKIKQQEEDVRKHNEEVENRYDRAINQVSNKKEGGPLYEKAGDNGARGE
ncbi:hypothetical protein LOZ58_000426 [Ophidiomyces ophidiicola]|nr:hypothetical protein LOZ65_000255 [Ophidiomyces ophidiicola]KAI1966936.1 hypothetical protein LOZ58_000426 [Ophidiomyces ophidiicola]